MAGDAAFLHETHQRPVAGCALCHREFGPPPYKSSAPSEVGRLRAELAECEKVRTERNYEVDRLRAEFAQAERDRDIAREDRAFKHRQCETLASRAERAERERDEARWHLKTRTDALIQRAERAEAERNQAREALKTARDLVAESYDTDERDDSPGNMAFAVLNAALARFDDGEEERQDA